MFHPCYDINSLSITNSFLLLYNVAMFEINKFINLKLYYFSSLLDIINVSNALKYTLKTV